jgi:hypothetical protein
MCQRSELETAIYSLGHGARAIEAAGRSVHDAEEKDDGCRYSRPLALVVEGIVLRSAVG